ncbi:MAG: hypothetical protein NVSMB19_21250 [Vulcanimicrobiaceae bacterium]
MVIPSFPPGEIRRIYLHWTGGDYATAYPAYHFCVASAADGEPIVIATHDVRANMRDVAAGDAPYAAHTAGRNSHALGIAICGMQDAAPSDFGRYPLREDFLAAGCELAARACDAYGIAVDAAGVATHAEAALADGYFGCGAEERWDIARLVAEPRSLEPADARRTGDLLRARIRARGARLA